MRLRRGVVLGGLALVAIDGSATASSVTADPAASQPVITPATEIASSKVAAEGNSDSRNARTKSKAYRFSYGVDRSSWFWVHQVDQGIGVGPVRHRVKLPSPQRPDTLPIAAESGKSSKVSAIRFDLVDRGIPPGSAVTRFSLTIAEGFDAGEAPPVNERGRALQACRATASWRVGAAELWKERPDVSNECVVGSRKTRGTSAWWTFDLTSLAREWGRDPFANNGVVLSGVLTGGTGAAETWQINLKIPKRDDARTPTDEYKKSAGRAVAQVSHTPKAAEGSSEAAGDGRTGGVAEGASSRGKNEGSLETDKAGRTEGAAGTSEQIGANPPLVPRLPAYAWLLIPLALLATAAVRAALFEPVVETRPGGVVESLRQHNAARRGTALTEDSGPLAHLMARLLAALPFGWAERWR